MNTIIARYLTKEILWNLCGVAGVLLLISLSNKLAQYLAKVATGELPLGFVLEIVGLYIPELLSLVLPLSLFMAILLVYSRLQVNSEMMVLFTSGMGWSKLVSITLFFASGVMILVGVLTLWGVPILETYRDRLVSEGEAAGVMQAMIPGRFQTMTGGKIVFYLENASARDQVLQGIFIAERPTAISEQTDNWTFITAQSATLKAEKTGKFLDYFLVLKQGYRYEGKPGKADFSVLRFEEYGREIEHKPTPVPADLVKYKTTHHLMTSKNLKDKGELQWRISIALSVFVLALLAVPLSYVKPRQGRFAKFLPAILIYIIYYNCFTVSKRWVSTGWIPVWLGVWWIHILMILLACIALVHLSGGWRGSLRSLKSRFIKT